MPANEPTWRTVRYQDFTGGENRAASLDLIEPNQIFLGMNCTMASDGSLETRKGKVKINTASLGAGAILSVFRWATEAGGKFLTVQHGTALYNVSWDGVSAVASFGTAVKTSLTAATKLRGIVWLNKLHLFNGTQNNFSFDGATTCTDHGGTPPKSKYAKIYAGRMWINDVANPNLIRFSNLETFATWDALDVIKFRDGDGDIITGIAAQPGGLVIFKNTSIWTMYGTNNNDIRVEMLSDTIGCVASDSILDHGFFAGVDNFYRFSLSEVTPYAPVHKPYLSKMTVAENALIVAAYLPFDQRIIVRMTTAIYLCFERSGAVFTWSGLNPQCLDACTISGDDGTLLVGDATNGIVYRLGSLEDDAGTSIPTDMRIAYNDMSMPQDKIFRAIRPRLEISYPRTAKPNNATVMYDIDNLLLGYEQTTPTFDNKLVWGIGHWGEKDWKAYFLYDSNSVFYFSERGRFIMIRIVSESRIKIKSLELKFRKIGRGL